jgi:hypothetical protein
MDIDFNLKVLSFKRKIFISKEWVRFGIILLAVLTSMIAAYWGPYRILILLMALLGSIAGALVLLKQPNLGFILIFLGGMFVPYSGPAGVNVAIFAVALMIGVWLMDMLVVQREFRLINSRALLPVAVMLAISVIAFFMGQVPWFVFANQAPLDAQAGGFAIFVLSLGGMLVAAHLIQDIKWLKIIVWTFIGLGAIYVFGRLVALPIDRLYQRGFTAGSMFWTWLVTLAFAQAFFNTRLKVSARVLLYGIVLATMFVALVRGYDWKSGWVPPLVAIAVMMGLKYKRLVILTVPFALIAVGNLAVRLIASDRYSWGTRVDAWEIILEISKVSPLFGLGFSNYYWYTPLFPIRGWVVSFNSHSQFVDLIAQVGVLGVLCFLWLFFEMGRLGWDLLKIQLPDDFAKAYVYGTFAGVIATLAGAFLGDWVLPFVYNVGLSGFRASVLPWIFMGGLLAVEQFIIKKVRVV